MIEGKEEKRKKIIVDEEVKNYIEQKGCDYRLKTSCGGPALTPLRSTYKETDIDISTGKHTLYVSNSIYMSRYYRDRNGYMRIGKELIGFRACRF